MMIRSGEMNLLHLFRQLTNQYWTDMFAKIVTERLNFIRHNQKKLRVENYIYLKDANINDGNLEELGQMVILPSTFTGGPRYMNEKTQDAMTYVRKYGRPDIFITFTCNPLWDEITAALMPGEKPQDRHDIISRVFKLKLKCLMDLLTKGKAFGTVQCYMFSAVFKLKLKCLMDLLTKGKAFGTVQCYMFSVECKREAYLTAIYCFGYRKSYLQIKSIYSLVQRFLTLFEIQNCTRLSKKQ